MKLSDKQKEVIKLMRKNSNWRITYERGVNDCCVFGSSRGIGNYPCSIATANKLFQLDLIESDGTERWQRETIYQLTELGKTINID